jgi:hypothetical protein
MRALLGMLIAIAALVCGSGCAGTHGVRYVYQDGEFGVIGIPENTDRWPTHYRRKAGKLMDAHFPEGHEIVRAEEVVEGTRTLTLQGKTTAELIPQLPTALLQVGSLGRSATRSQADNLKIRESRIVYRRATHHVTTAAYAEVATLTPTHYVDPNAIERRKGAKEEPVKEKPGANTADEKSDESGKTTSAPEKPQGHQEPTLLSEGSRLSKKPSTH